MMKELENQEGVVVGDAAGAMAYLTKNQAAPETVDTETLPEERDE